MVKLDKSKKLDHITYFYFPRLSRSDMYGLMKNSKENQFRIYTHKQSKHAIPKKHQIEALQYYSNRPDFIEYAPCVCVSKYNPDYLFEMLELYKQDPDVIENILQASEDALNSPDYREGE